MSDPDPISALVARWRADGAKLRPPASTALLDAFEARHSIRLPSDFRALYQRADGMPDDEFVDCLLCWWSLEQIEREKGAFSIDREDGRYFYVIFADGMICSQHYCLRLDPNGAPWVFAIFGDWANPEHMSVPVADSIRDMAAQYPREGLPGCPLDLPPDRE